MTTLEPGAGQPYPPGGAVAIAGQFGVTPADVQRWVADGLPTLADGRIDPMTCCNWLSWGRLDRSPALARRWRSYLACFEPHLGGADERLRHRWQRHHALFLPHAVTDLHWWLPDPVTRGVQTLEASMPLAGPGLDARPAAGGTLLIAPEATDEVTAVGTATVATATWREDLEPGERRALLAVVEPLVAGFRYEYRRHAHDECIADAPLTGTCLDCALALLRALRAAGRTAVLEGGLVARSDIANAHYWVVVETLGGRRVPVDPSIPAIARMLGRDWRAWTRAWLGAIDARRIVLSSEAVDWPHGGERFVDPVPGEAWCTEGDLWACQDWVCGRTRADFTSEKW